MFLRNVVIFAILATSIPSLVLFLVRTWDAGFDDAWAAFEEHVDRCMGDSK